MNPKPPDRTPMRALVVAACAILYYISVMVLIIVLTVGAIRWAF